MKIITLKTAFAMLVAGAFAASAHAQTVTGYNETNARAPGYGVWEWYYNGTMTPSGGLFNYTGNATGTLNDGILGDSAYDTQLFNTADNTSIQLSLNGSYDLTSITLYSFNNGNVIPGDIAGADVTIGGNTDFIAASAPDANNTQVLNLVGSGLDLTPTTDFTLSGFTLNPAYSFAYAYGYYSISEVGLNGSPVNNNNVPDGSTTVTLLGGALAGLAALRRRFSK